jgi:hypothetical protein
MTAVATVAASFKGKVFDVATALWATSNPEMLVTYGRPGVNVPDDVCMILGVESSQEPGAIGPQRQREETLTIDVQWWIFRAGEEDAEREATEYLYARMGELEQYFRVTDTTLDGLVRDCFLSSHQFDTTEADSRVSGRGRLAVANAQFVAHVRIRTIP